MKTVKDLTFINNIRRKLRRKPQIQGWLSVGGGGNLKIGFYLGGLGILGQINLKISFDSFTGSSHKDPSWPKKNLDRSMEQASPMPSSSEST